MLGGRTDTDGGDFGRRTRRHQVRGSSLFNMRDKPHGTYFHDIYCCVGEFGCSAKVNARVLIEKCIVSRGASVRDMRKTGSLNAHPRRDCKAATIGTGRFMVLSNSLWHSYSETRRFLGLCRNTFSVSRKCKVRQCDQHKRYSKQHKITFN